MSLEVRPIRSRAEERAFIRLPSRILAHDPAWIPPLEREQRALVSRRHNPFFDHGDAEFFVAWKNGQPVGRISAQVDHLHLERYADDTGFFGCFDAPDDPEVVSALWAACEAWHRQRGHARVLGPYNLNINGEAGVLIEGFDTPPYLLMTHALPHYGPRLEEQGLAKAKDLYAWRYKPGDIPDPARQLAEATETLEGLRIRSVDPTRLDAEVRTIMTIFNEAWSQNWGYLPLTERELAKMAQDLRPILDPEVALIAELNGEPAAMALSLPNVNEAIADLHGRLFPTGAIKLLWRLWRRKIRSLRLVVLGIRPELRGRPELKGLSVLLYVESHRRAKARGYTEAELSWTLEDNVKINRGIELMGGKRYKTFRLYEKALS